MKDWIAALEQCPIIPVVRHEDQLSRALKSRVAWVFLACGDINTVAEPVRRTREAGKLALLYLDFVAGVGADLAAVRFVRDQLQADGLVTVKSQVVQYAREEGLWAVQNLFVIDTQAVKTGLQAVSHSRPHVIEILPGIMPRVIAEIASQGIYPLLAGGLLESHEDIEQALLAGATAVGTSHTALWPHVAAGAV